MRLLNPLLWLKVCLVSDSNIMTSVPSEITTTGILLCAATTISSFGIFTDMEQIISKLLLCSNSINFFKLAVFHPPLLESNIVSFK